MQTLPKIHSLPHRRSGFLFRILGWCALGLSALPCTVFPKELAQFGVRQYGRQDGISASSILEIIQSREGYLWMGTYDGLTRFNGVEFRVFNRANTPALPGDNITSLLEASDGTLWVGTLGKGIQGFLDPNLNHARPGAALNDISATDLEEDSQGRIYAAAREGLFVFEQGTWSPCHIGSPSTEVRVIDAIEIDEHDHVLLARADGIFRWDGVHLSPLDPKLPNDVQVQGFEYRANAGLWFGTFEAGLYHYKHGAVRHYRVEDGLLHDNIGDLSFDAQGKLWIGSRGGVSVLREGEFSHFTMKGQMVYSVQHDREGGIWVGTYLHGLYRLGNTRFASYTNTDPSEIAIIGRAVIQFNDTQLIGTNLGIHEIVNGYLVPSKRFPDLGNIMIRSLKPGRNGGIWIGTHTHGVFQLTPDGSVRSFGFEQGLQSLTNRCVIEDRTGRVWIAGNRGLQVMEEGNIRDVAGLQGFPILSLHELRDGTIAVASDGDGLYLLRPGSVEHYTKADGLSSDVVFYVHEDGDEALWITASEAGISRLKDGQMHFLGKADGMPPDAVFYIVEDPRGDFWMASNSGIYRAAAASLRARIEQHAVAPTLVRHDQMDGINAGGVTGVTHAYQDPDGEIWFPTTHGVVSVNPLSEQQAMLAPKVLIESFSTETRDFDLHRTSEQIVEPGTQRFTFSFVGIQFHATKRVRYRAKLEGYEDEFSDIENRREISYTNLKPGTYRFIVQAGLQGGDWSEASDSITFTLQPHLHQIPLFRWIAALCILVLLFGIVRLRIVRSQARQRHLEETVEQRTSELRMAMAEAESANRSKSLFLASVSHEVRNPMNGILGITELLLAEDLQDEPRRKLQIVQSSARSLLTILNDLLDYSKLDSNQLTLESVPFSIRTVVDETLALQEAGIRENNLEIHVNLDPALPQTVIGDPLRHRQVLHNLISNAVKFTERGSISIRVEMESLDSQACMVRFSVKDTGIGISKAAQQRLFQAYQQADESTARHYGGTGLGLAICRSLVERMGGRIQVESELGQGATFTFTSRLGVAGAELPPDPHHALSDGLETDHLAESRPLQVLVVDDEKINLEIARVIFGKCGLHITAALGPAEAIQKLQSERYDALFVDYLMPEIDGATLTRKIRSRSIKIPNPTLTIVAVTGATSREEREHLLEAGVNHILEKPILPGTLRPILDECARAQANDAPSNSDT